MATTATDQEEELLIISDDTEETNEIELTLEEESSSDDDILSFDEAGTTDKKIEEITLDNTPELDLGWLKNKSEDTELNMDFDLWGEESEMTVEKMLGEKEKQSEEKIKIDSKEDDIFDFGIEEEIKQEDAIETNVEEVSKDDNVEWDNSFDISLEDNETSDEVVAEEVIATSWDDSSSWWDDWDDVNAILNATIAKLIVRKEQIESVKEKTIDSIAKLNEEIKWLQTEVKNHKTEVKEFDKETAKISENVESLEKMKMN